MRSGVSGDILDRIVEERRRRVAEEGPAQGVRIPAWREVPLVPLVQEPCVIAEFKRRSPSRGAICDEADPVVQVGAYVAQGVRAVSVLTEEAYFGGSLADLMRVKERFPHLAVLRKDFLLSEEDVEVSYRAGADAVLLIARVLPQDRLGRMLDLTGRCGMTALVEVHTPEDVEKVRRFEPPLVGINARDLATFRVDLLHPVRLRGLVDWDARVVFESGLWTRAHGYVAGSSGAWGVLVGEAVMREQGRVREIMEGLAAGKRDWVRGRRFWSGLPAGRTLVKVCGLTREEDVALADRLGADLLGFILAPSPRQVDRSFLERIGPVRARRVGVVVGEQGGGLEEAVRLVEEGLLDGIQCHGEEDPEVVGSLCVPWYKAVRVRERGDLEGGERYGAVRVLLDARVEGVCGGTGVRVPEEVVEEAARRGPVWLAGGLGPGNVGEVVRRFRPELVDASSGLEAAPGVKDREKLERFFREIRDAEGV
ncbi:bifunctional indole-3-glycerol phosphate synthase/phosphoribosylanthranilate isomerase [Spirochaeta thermophila]|uniref:N-(5'-phosphoribosyl)anthranilate isomerase n=1 Tax=Winmispira thermophila (strain ATCC 49972 / DSM 6192 / RI 19.B1) TaxID=665571 RepID=E0RNF7_WINT6|nr:bifunctional indole-3-glycerol phosphate synthase/phosphoribosylanthranilate isomerase [Spirochaeta thermophila]ADN01157.1 anthranilate synthase component [Spirochaeta thermophila DSM 6192]